MGPKKQPIVKLPPELPKGFVLPDKNQKKQWILLKQLGTGGFGRIYEAQCKDTREYAVVKMEPLNSGPLFCEQNFALRCLKAEHLKTYLKLHKLAYLSLPEFYSFGISPDGKLRFLVMQRLGRNLESVLDVFNWKLPEALTYQVTLALLEALEYIHSCGFVHADIKGSNIIFGHGAEETRKVYLCDFGLATKQALGIYFITRFCKHFHFILFYLAYKEDKKLQHNGTIEYTSREAHRGAPPSRRGDLEILGYCLVHWMCGTLPWIKVLGSPEKVSAEKHGFFEKLPSSLLNFFPNCPTELKEYFTVVSKLEYQKPADFVALKKIFLVCIF